MPTTRTLTATTRVYYAQVKTPLGMPPTARILEGYLLRKSKRPNTWRVRFDHAPFGIECDESWLTPNAETAPALLRARIAATIAEHTRQATQLLAALAEAKSDLIIQWPPGKSRHDPQRLDTR